MSHPERTTHRRRAMGFEEFATSGKKGVTRAIQEFQARKERKHKAKAVLLRQYKSAMRKEGYQAGTGGKRKRSLGLEDGTVDETAAAAAASPVSTLEHGHAPQKRQRRHKANPFAASLEKAQTVKETRVEQEREQEARQREQHVKQKQRKARSRTLSKRTRRGQPVMQHVIHNILDKLEHDSK